MKDKAEDSNSQMKMEKNRLMFTDYNKIKAIPEVLP